MMVGQRVVAMGNPEQFWSEVLAIFLGDVAASILLVPIFLIGRRFVRILGFVDIRIGYNWSWEGSKFYPNFDIRNSSGNTTYALANVKYTRNNGRELVWIDNKSLWGKELKPGSIVHLSGDPVAGVTSLQQCLGVEVTVRTQDQQEFKGAGPGQLRASLLKRASQFFRRRKQ
jgi:hypothetical protein